MKDNGKEMQLYGLFIGVDSDEHYFVEGLWDDEKIRVMYPYDKHHKRVSREDITKAILVGFGWLSGEYTVFDEEGGQI